MTKLQQQRLLTAASELYRLSVEMAALRRVASVKCQEDIEFGDGRCRWRRPDDWCEACESANKAHRELSSMKKRKRRLCAVIARVGRWANDGGVL